MTYVVSHVEEGKADEVLTEAFSGTEDSKSNEIYKEMVDFTAQKTGKTKEELWSGVSFNLFI